MTQEGAFFNSFCDFNDDPDIPELESGSDSDEMPEMEDLSLRTKVLDYRGGGEKRPFLRCS